MSSVPHVCPRDRRCFDCHPRVGAEHASELPAWATMRHGVVDAVTSRTEAQVQRLVDSLIAVGVDRSVARREAPLLLSALVIARVEETSERAIDAFTDHYQRGSR